MESETGWQIAKWAWEQRDEIAETLSRIYKWFRGSKQPGQESRPGILILGAGGVGKTTLGGFLSGQFDLFSRPPGEYLESLETETFEIMGGSPSEIVAEAVVPPGQEHKRAATWTELFNDLAAGKFRGVILMSAYGYHSLGNISYKKHRLFQRGKNKFLEAFLADRRNEELAVLNQLAPYMLTSRRELWFLSLIAKQDLWWKKQADVKRHYEEGPYGVEVQKLLGQRGQRDFRHEFAYTSLVIGNYVTGMKESLQPNTAGFDHHQYVHSLRRLFEMIESLRKWEISNGGTNT
jgi:hypothetical protein